jgi:hypothetical protein
VLVKWQSGGIDGAYFNRYVTSFDPVPWLAAALALLIVGTAALIAAAVHPHVGVGSARHGRRAGGLG